MAGNAVVGFEVWMEVIALDVESDGLRMLLAVTGSYWQLLLAVIQLLADIQLLAVIYWQLLAVTGSSCKMVPYYWHLQLLAVIHT